MLYAELERAIELLARTNTANTIRFMDAESLLDESGLSGISLSRFKSSLDHAAARGEIVRKPMGGIVYYCSPKKD